MHLQIPDVSLLTAAGPGFFDAAIASTPGAPSTEALVAAVRANVPNYNAVEIIRSELGLSELTLNTAVDRPLICDYYTTTNLVTTTFGLADPVSPRDEAYYREAGKAFVYVGPLLDVAGAKRAAGNLQASHPEDAARSAADEEAQASLMKLVNEAVLGGRRIIYVSLGTVITSDDASHGWHATSGSAITGRQLCQAVYRAVFDKFGDSRPLEEGPPPLVVVALGPQADALEGIQVPSNALCARAWPQVDLLRTARPLLFVTNGGQNSLMESMAVGTPVVLCPGFGDQVANAAKVTKQGWGVGVDRPAARADPAASEFDAIVSSYQTDIQNAMQTVLSGEFAQKAKTIAAELEQAGGVEAALRVLLSAAKSSPEK